MKKAMLIRESRDFTSVFSNGKKISGTCFRVLVKPNSLKIARLGRVVAKKQFKSAVTRNKVKRLITESFRLNNHNVAGKDIVVIPTAAFASDFSGACKELITLWEKLKKC